MRHVHRDGPNLGIHYPTDECTTACRNRKIISHAYPAQLYVGTDKDTGQRTIVAHFLRGRTPRLALVQFIADMLPAAVTMAASLTITNTFTGDRPDTVRTDGVAYWLAGIIFAVMLSNVLRGLVRSSEREAVNAPVTEDVRGITDIKVLADTREALIADTPAPKPTD